MAKAAMKGMLLAIWVEWKVGFPRRMGDVAQPENTSPTRKRVVPQPALRL